MKKIFRFCLSFILVLCLFSGLALCAFAESTVSYNANRTISISPGDELFVDFKNIMPGDEISQTIQLVNRCTRSDFVYFYLRAVPHTPEEGPHRSDVAAKEDYESMMDFLSQLHIVVTAPRGVVFDDRADVTGELEYRKPLASMRGKDSAAVTVTISAPITMGNEYADRMGEIDWMIYVEERNAGDEPMTGDSSQIFLYAGILLISAAALFFILFYLRRKKAE